jgi:hypothetical protein
MSADLVDECYYAQCDHEWPCKVGKRAAEEIERLRALLADVRCPCGALYVKVEGGYVPSCACAADRQFTVADAWERRYSDPKAAKP